MDARVTRPRLTSSWMIGALTNPAGRATTREPVGDELAGDVAFRDSGEHRLKDLDRPEHLFQLVVGDLRADFPALTSLSPGSGGANGLPPVPNRTIGRADGNQPCARSGRHASAPSGRVSDDRKRAASGRPGSNVA